jgi:TP901 family phage tail tape measure protein
MGSEVFNLYLLLTLKDYASGGLDRIEAKLRETGKAGAATLRTFQSLREDLKRDLVVAGIGVGTLMALRKGVAVAGDFEQAMTDLKLSIAEIDPGTGVENLTKLNDQMARSQALAVRLGNTLPGSTQDFLQMMTVLRQGGMQTERVLGGGGEAVAHLSIVTHTNPAELAKDYAQVGEMFQLTTQKEWMRAADISARLYRATGIRPEEQVQGLKFAQIRAGSNLGLKGLEGYESLGRILGTLRTFGLEGGFGGRELSRFLMQLASFEKNAAKLKKTEGIDLHAKGIDLKFFDQKGKFAGFDNIFKQLEKLRVLSEQERIKVGEKVFTAEGTAIATAFMTAGEEGWKKINARVDAVLPLEQQIVQTTDTWNTKLENVQGTLSNVTATGFKPLNEQLKPVLDNTNTLLGYTQSFLEGHPQMTQLGLDFVVIGGTVLTVTGGMRALITMINLARIASAVAAGESIASAGKVSLSLAGVRGMLSSLSKPVKIAIIATEVMWVLSELRELKAIIADVNRMDAERARGATAYADQIKKTQASGPVPQSLYAGAARNALTQIDLEGTLSRAFVGSTAHVTEPVRAYFGIPEKAPLHEQAASALWSFATFGPLGRSLGIAPNYHPFYEGRDEDRVNLLRKRAPELQTPQVMSEFIKAVQGLKSWDEQSRKGLLDLAQKAYPDSYKQGSDLLAKTFSSFTDQAQKTTDGLGKLNQPLSVLPSQFSNAGSAAQRFSDRLDAIELKTPGLPGTEAPKGPLSSLVIQSKASGGTVLKGGLVNVHAREEIVPARVTEQWRNLRETSRQPIAEFHPAVARMILAEARGQRSEGRGQVIHNHHDNRSVAVHVHASTNDPEELARLVARAVEIQMERA